MFGLIVSTILTALAVVAAVFILSRLIRAIALHAKNQEEMIQLLGEIRDSLIQDAQRAT